MCIRDRLLFYQSVNDIDPTWDYSPSADCYSHLYADTSVKKQDIRAKAVFGADNSRIIKFPNGSTGQFVTNEQPSQTPIVVARVAEMYLIKAEALGATNGLSTLKEFMNKRYATVSLPSSMSDTEFQNQILDERHREPVSYTHLDVYKRQAFIRVWEVRERVEPESSFISFLCTIAKNLLMNMYQRCLLYTSSLKT